jgi:hypothetical protein
VAVPFHPIIYGLEPEVRKQAIGEVVEGYRRYYDGQKVNLPAAIVLASGVRRSSETFGFREDLSSRQLGE